MQSKHGIDYIQVLESFSIGQERKFTKNELQAQQNIRRTMYKTLLGIVIGLMNF